MADRLGEQFMGRVEVLATTLRETPRPDDLSLLDMARRALGYLRGNPEPSRHYECRFSLGPLGIPCHHPLVPSNEYAFDPVSLADTDSRMHLQYGHLRAMCGEEPEAVERGVDARVRGYQREDGLVWSNPVAFTGSPVDGEWASTWASGKLLMVLAEEHEADGEDASAARARRVFEAIRALASWDGERAYYPAGPAPWRDGEWLDGGWAVEHRRNYPSIVEPLVRYWEGTADEEALDFAIAVTEGFLAGSQPNQGDFGIDPETGAFAHHVHLHTHAVWGVAHLGAVLAEPRYLDWARRVYEFVRARGTDYGWYPEFIPQSEYRAELCVVGDMNAIAGWLARGGEPHYWDHVERTVRNLLRRTQFSLSPEFVALFERLHADRDAGEVKDAIAWLRRLEGGFVAQPTFDDWIGYPATLGATGMNANGLQMMGCCPPEGMRALWEAWGAIVESRPDGVFINLALTRDHPAAGVKAFRPEDGGYAVEARRKGDHYLRVPAWADRDAVTVTRRDEPAKFEWAGPAGAYAKVKARTGDTLVVRWPVPTFVQTFVPQSVPGRDEPVTVRWEGQVVKGVEPRGEYLPMFGAA